MKRTLSLFFLLTALSVSAHCQSMADVLRTMPDSVMPLLTLNDRLDLVDEWQAGVKAEVKNRLGGMVTLTELSDTKAVLQTSSLSTVTLELTTMPDGTTKAVRRQRTCTVDGQTDTSERLFPLARKEQ